MKHGFRKSVGLVLFCLCPVLQGAVEYDNMGPGEGYDSTSYGIGIVPGANGVYTAAAFTPAEAFRLDDLQLAVGLSTGPNVVKDTGLVVQDYLWPPENPLFTSALPAFRIEGTPVPEPSTWVLLSTGLGSVISANWFAGRSKVH